MKKDEFVKLGIDEELAKKCEEASLAELKDYIPKTRFDEVNTEKKQLEGDIADRDRQLEDLKNAAGDSEALQQRIETLQAENRQVRIDAAVDKALTGAKAKNLTAVKALLKDLDKAELSDDGSIKGLEEQIKSLKKADDSKFLFEEEKKPVIKGVSPGESSDGLPQAMTKEQFNRMSYKERLDLYNTDRETYDAMTAE